MSLCSGDVVYASLAQMAVKGQANAKVEGLAIGMLDVFSSAFWSHPSFAHSVIRNCDEELAFNKDASNVHIFEPPKSFDVVYNMWATIDIPGLVNMASIAVRDGDKNGKVRRTGTGEGVAEYEVLNKKDTDLVPKFNCQLVNKGADFAGETGINTKTGNDVMLIEGTDLASAQFLEQLVNENAYAEITITADDNAHGDYKDSVNGDQTTLKGKRCIVTNYGDPLVGKGYSVAGSDLQFAHRQLWVIENDSYRIGYPGATTVLAADNVTQVNQKFANLAATSQLSFIQTGLDTYVDSIKKRIVGSPFVFSDSQPRYVDSVGQYIIKECEMTIGGARVGLLNSMYLYIHEELMGQPGRRMYEMCGKQGDLSDPAWTKQEI